MRSTRQITAVLVLAACAAVGCSKRGDTSQAKPEGSPEPAQAASVTIPSNAAASTPAQKDDEGFGEVVKPKTAGPVSFADGEAAYQAKNYSAATTIFESYTGQRPDNAWGHFMLGLSAWKAGDHGKAEQAFETALSIDPDHLKSLVNLSRVLIEQKRFDNALDTLMRAGDVDPNSNEVYRLIGRAYHASGKTDDAADAYRRAIELDDNDAWSLNNLGLLFLEKQRADEAVPLLTKAVELKKDVPAFHNNLGMALEHSGKFGAAAVAYSDALTADPDYEKAKLNLARVDAVKKSPEEDPTISDDEKAGSK
jgi:tetratricopeptide (TPR) repeat protein